MGIGEKTKEAGKKTGAFGKKVGKGIVGLGKKGVGATKKAVHKKTCVECKHYDKIDDTKGNCPIAGERLSSAAASTCPQNAFEAR
jgi:hypothetical protein